MKVPEIKRPQCAKCGAIMMMARIAPDGPDSEVRTFDCAKCGHIQSEVVIFSEGPEPLAAG